MRIQKYLLVLFLTLLLASAGAAHAIDIKPLPERVLKEYAALSPFEFKNILGEKAAESGKPILNAGRGNPNFINTRVRLAFAMLHRFAVAESLVQDAPADLGFPPRSASGMADRLRQFLAAEKDTKSAEFLLQCMAYCENQLQIAPDTFTADMVDALLGDHYPTPSRMLTTPERIVEAYLKDLHFSPGRAPEGKFHVFATEGATAAMIYVFNTLKENFLVTPGDAIAIITPIFSPYLEIPVLNDYELKPIYVTGSEQAGWQVPDAELEKLKDKRIKALFMVNPMNPGAVSMNAESVNKLAALVKTERSDLIVLTDTVYCPFVDEFHDLLEAIPENCIGVFSFSKYFGVTGWRLGVIFIHERTILDAMIRNLPDEKKQLLDKRYETVDTAPRNIPFIERLLMDSRAIALAHTGGLSTPQQGIMSLFSLYDLLDKDHAYKKSIQALLTRRMNNVYAALRCDPPSGPGQTQYYNLLNILDLATRLHGAEFAEYLKTVHSPFGFLLELAGRYQTVLLPGIGFAGPEWSVRISLANLPDDAYTTIGNNLASLLDDYAQCWKQTRKP